ncbi:MAG: type IV secretion system protein [Candidatus Desulfofervidus auxilii]|nr:type IV secretion system protein [Candidatus Desulfofervidus auxilii]
MFVSFGKMGEKIVALLDPSKSVTLVAGFQTIVATWAIIYILYIAYMFHLGKVDNPVRQVVYKLMMFGFISLFAFNAGEWYNYAIGAIQGLTDWISGGGVNSIYKDLDDGLKTIDKIHQIYFEHDSIKWLKLLAIMGTGIIFLSYMAVGLTASILLIINTITLQIIFVLAPFAFLSLFFPLVRGIFDRWIEMIISNIFTIFFLSLFTEVIFTEYKNILDGINPLSVTPGYIYDTTNVDIILSAFVIFGFSVLGVVLLYMSTQLASKLSSVSIESIPKGAAIATATTGMVAGKGYSAGKSVGKSTYNTAKKSTGKVINGVSGVSRKAGDAGSKAHKLLRETGKKARAERKAGGKKN